MKKVKISTLSFLAISLMLVGCSAPNKGTAKQSSSKDAESEKIASSKKAAKVSKRKKLNLKACPKHQVKLKP